MSNNNCLAWSCQSQRSVFICAPSEVEIYLSQVLSTSATLPKYYAFFFQQKQ